MMDPENVTMNVQSATEAKPEGHAVVEPGNDRNNDTLADKEGTLEVAVGKSSNNMNDNGQDKTRQKEKEEVEKTEKTLNGIIRGEIQDERTRAEEDDEQATQRKKGTNITEMTLCIPTERQKLAKNEQEGQLEEERMESQDYGEALKVQESFVGLGEAKQNVGDMLGEQEEELEARKGNMESVLEQDAVADKQELLTEERNNEIEPPIEQHEPSNEQATLKPEEQNKMQGCKLRDIPNGARLICSQEVAFHLSKLTGKSDIMESLHNLMYRRKGLVTQRKKGVLEFKGFLFPDATTEEKEIQSRRGSAQRMTLDQLNKVMTVLDLPKGKQDKQQKIDSIISFLRQPEKVSDVDLASRESEKKRKKQRRRQRELKKKAKRASTSIKVSKSQKEVEEEQEDEDIWISEEEQEEEEQADPVAQMSVAAIKGHVHKILGEMSNDELGMVTTKIILSKLNDVLKMDMRPRKAEIKQIAQEFASERLN